MLRYRGRFAPAPTGPLHFGSVVAALASYLQARSQLGEWLLRIEDIDKPRVNPEARASILSSLEKLGLFWDGEIISQIDRLDTYIVALEILKSKNIVYPCACSRKQYKGRPYPGTCRKGIPGDKSGRALRITTNNDPVEFNDLIQGQYSQCLENEIGDFIISRADGIIAYHLAVVVDDEEQGITEILRGADLIDSTPRQIYLQKILGYNIPVYIHIPVIVDKKGNKLSKQNFAPPLNLENPGEIIINALKFLNQSPDPELINYSPVEIIQWGIKNWKLQNIPKKNKIKIDVTMNMVK